jgi:hypothetical protein
MAAMISPPTEEQLAQLARLLTDQATEPETANVSAQLALQLVGEIRRLRGLLNTASSYLVDQDAHCQGCDRAIISADHAPECPAGRIIAEFGSEDD